MIKKIALVWSGGGSEHEYYQFEESSNGQIKFFLACSKVGGNSGNDHDVSSLLQTSKIEWINEAVQRVLCLNPDCIFWACTSGSFISGRKFAEKQVEAIKNLSGKPSGSTSLAFIKALNYLNIKNVSIIATYPEIILKKFSFFLNEFQINIINSCHLNAPSGWASSKIDQTEIEKKIKEMNFDKSQAILIPDTALPTLDKINVYEKLTNKYILTANQVTIWDAINLCGGFNSTDDFINIFKNLGKLYV